VTVSEQRAVIADGDAATSDGSADASRMRRVAVASFMGTVVEFYDFIIYGTAAALVFSAAFFPALGDQAASVVSYATLGVAFVARPVGAILFGHFGDRLGRKRTLVATMLTMGASTVLIGILPTAATIGVAAPVLLIVMRFAQGLAAGGEWAGAALFTCENAPADRRGFWSMFTNLGGAAANMLAAFTFLAISLFMSDSTFESYGWRVPFILSSLLVAVGLYIRLRLEDTPVFKDQLRNGGAARLPFVEAFAKQWKQILLGAGSLLSSFAINYLGASYLIGYGTETLQINRSAVLAASMFGGLMLGVGVLAGGTLSDRIGRRRILIIANSVAIPWAVCLFPILDLDSLASFWIGIGVSFLIAGFGFGVAGAFLSELFATRYRYTAAGLGYSLAGIVGGAVPPLVAASVISTWGSFVYGLMLAGVAAVALACTLATKETSKTDLTAVSAEA
jgi:MFS family permease